MANFNVSQNPTRPGSHSMRAPAKPTLTWHKTTGLIKGLIYPVERYFDPDTPWIPNEMNSPIGTKAHHTHCPMCHLPNSHQPNSDHPPCDHKFCNRPCNCCKTLGHRGSLCPDFFASHNWHNKNMGFRNSAVPKYLQIKPSPQEQRVLLDLQYLERAPPGTPCLLWTTEPLRWTPLAQTLRAAYQREPVPGPQGTGPATSGMRSGNISGNSMPQIPHNHQMPLTGQNPEMSAQGPQANNPGLSQSKFPASSSQYSMGDIDNNQEQGFAANHNYNAPFPNPSHNQGNITIPQSTNTSYQPQRYDQNAEYSNSPRGGYDNNFGGGYDNNPGGGYGNSSWGGYGNQSQHNGHGNINNGIGYYEYLARRNEKLEDKVEKLQEAALNQRTKAQTPKLQPASPHQSYMGYQQQYSALPPTMNPYIVVPNQGLPPNAATHPQISTAPPNQQFVPQTPTASRPPEARFTHPDPRPLIDRMTRDGRPVSDYTNNEDVNDIGDDDLEDMFTNDIGDDDLDDMFAEDIGDDDLAEMTAGIADPPTFTGSLQDSIHKSLKKRNRKRRPRGNTGNQSDNGVQKRSYTDRGRWERGRGNRGRGNHGRGSRGRGGGGREIQE